MLLSIPCDHDCYCSQIVANINVVIKQFEFNQQNYKGWIILNYVIAYSAIVFVIP